MEPTTARLIPAASIFETLCDLSRPADVRASSKVRLDRFPSPQHDIETEKNDNVADDIDHAFSMLPPGNNEIHQDYLRERQLIGVAIQSCNLSSNG